MTNLHANIKSKIKLYINSVVKNDQIYAFSFVINF